MKNVLYFIAIAFLTGSTTVANAQDSFCYMEDENGNAIDLGGLCGYSSNYVAPSIRDIIDFPDYVFDPSLDTPPATRNVTLTDGYEYILVYQNRFMQRISKYPFTQDASNEYETNWVDCSRGWTYVFNIPLVSSNGVWRHIFGPSIGAQYFPHKGITTTGASQELQDANRDFCNTMEVPTVF
jgi:hypothetical protein